MSGKEIEQVPAEAQELERAGTESAASGLAAELSNQLQNFEVGQKLTVSDSSNIAKILPGYDGVKIGVSEKERAKAVGQLNESLEHMVTGELTHLREMMQRNGLDTKEVDKKIKLATAEVEAVKPLQEAVLSGNIAALQKMVGGMKPEQLAQHTELLQKHFDRAGIDLELDYQNGQLILSKGNGDRAVAISADKTDVIGINKDGSYDFGRQYRHENSAKELQGMADSSLSNYLYPPRKIIHEHWNIYEKGGRIGGGGGSGGGAVIEPHVYKQWDRFSNGK